MPKTKIQAEWDLSQLYRSPNDPVIDKDIALVEKTYVGFAKKYSKTNAYLKSEKALAKALADLEKILDSREAKPYMYLHLFSDKNTQNKEVQAKFNLVLQRLQKIGNLTVFFSVNLSKIKKPFRQKFLKSKILKRYRYYLKQIFDQSKFTLSEKEEKILSLKALPSHGMWTESVKKMRTKETVKHKGESVAIPEASELVRTLRTQKERIMLHEKIMEKYAGLADAAEAELNAIVTNKKINDELRGHKEPYDSTILRYENEEKTVLNLVEAVTDSFDVSRRFYKIKAKMLGLKKLSYADRAVSAGETKKKIIFAKAYEILRKVFASIDPEFAAVLERFVSTGQVDVYSKLGKIGGAYCSGSHNVPTFILLNYADSFESLLTFAHETGHGIHTEFSKRQPVLYEGYSTSTAETASTLFESFVFYDQFEKLSPKEKVIALHNKIQEDIQTVFRQIACFNFELEMHKTIRQKGNLSKEGLAELMNKHMKSYLGDVKLTEKDGYFFVGWPHIRSFFYVYSYAFGQLISKALFQKWKEDKRYIEEIKKFLSAGGSMSPEDIFKSIGIDITKPDFWKKGIENIKEDVILLEKLVNKK